MLLSSLPLLPCVLAEKRKLAGPSLLRQGRRAAGSPISGAERRVCGAERDNLRPARDFVIPSQRTATRSAQPRFSHPARYFGLTSHVFAAWHLLPTAPPWNRPPPPPRLAGVTPPDTPTCRESTRRTPQQTPWTSQRKRTRWKKRT